MTNTTMGQRIRERRKAKKLTLQAVGDAFGITRGAVAAWERDETRPDQDKLPKLAIVLDTTIDYLLTGEGPAESQTRSRSVGRLRSAVAELPAQYDANLVPDLDLHGRVPLISWVQAGNWAEIVDNFAPGDAEEWLLCPAKHGPHAFAARVEGKSMYNPDGEKSYDHGDIIFVDPDRPYHNGSMVVVRLENEKQATFKRLHIDGDKMYLEALNPDWPNRIMEVKGPATICGVVFGKWVPE